MSKQEDIESDDSVAVHLNTFHDHHRAYVLTANPLGIQQDGIWTEGQEQDNSFDALWHSQGRLTGQGFVVLMAIPFRSLRFSGAPLQTWGIALSRSIRRNNERSFWPRITQRIASLAQQFASLEGLEPISPGRNMQFIPYFAASRARRARFPGRCRGACGPRCQIRAARCAHI